MDNQSILRVIQFQENHPIIGLLSTRITPSIARKQVSGSNEIPQFSNLPTFEKSQINTLSDNLKEKNELSFASIFKLSIPNFIHLSFSNEEVNSLMKIIETKTSALDAALVCLFYYQLDFIIHSETDHPLSVMEISCKCCRAAIHTGYSQIGNFLFEEVLFIFLKDNLIRWTEEIIVSILHLFIINDSFSSSLSSKILLLISAAQQLKNSKVDQELQTTLLSLLLQKPSYIESEDYFTIFVLLQPYLANLDFLTVRIISFLSNTPEFSKKKDVFINLPYMILLSIKSAPLIMNPSEMEKFTLSDISDQSLISISEFEKKDFSEVFHKIYKNDPELINNDFANANYFDNGFQKQIFEDDNSFDNGFSIKTIPETQYLEILLGQNLARLLYNVADSLKGANSSCVDVFFLKLMNEILSDQDNFFYDEFAAFLYLAKELLSITSLFQLQPIFTSSKIFNPSITIFTSISIEMNTLRDEVFKLLASSSPSTLAEIINNSYNSPFLLAEHLSRFMNLSDQPDFRILTTAKTLAAISYSLRYFIHVRHTNKSQASFNAINTILSFIFNLLHTEYQPANSTSDHKEDISALSLAGECFNSRPFIETFFSLIFESSLQDRTLRCFRSFLINVKNPNELMMLTSYLYELFGYLKTFETEQKESLNQQSLGCKLLENLVDALSHNLAITSSLNLAINQALSYAESFANPSLLQYSIKLLSLIARSVSNFQLSVTQFRQLLTIIDKVEGIEPSQSTELALFSFCANSPSISQNALFVLQNSSVISLIFSAFGRSTKIYSILNKFSDLCLYSQTNCCLCHKGDLDYILLQIVTELIHNKEKNKIEIKETTNLESTQHLKTNNYTTIVYRGIMIDFVFKYEDIENIIFPFLSKLLSIHSSHAIASQLINLITENNSTSYMIANFVLSQVSIMAGRLEPSFPLGHNHPCLYAKNVDYHIFNNSFSFCIWVNVDRLMIIDSKSSISLFTISDGLHTLSLFFNRDSVYIQTNEISTQCTTFQKSNEWFFITFALQPSSEKTSTIGLYIDGMINYCEELPRVIFTENVYVHIGGTIVSSNSSQELISTVDSDMTIISFNNSIDYGIIGSFGFQENVIQEDDIDNLIRLGLQGIKGQNFFLTGNVWEGGNLQIEVTEVYKQSNALDNILADFDFYSQFVPLFETAPIKTDKSNLIEIVLSLLKLLLVKMPCDLLYPSIRNALLAGDPSRLTYGLYIALYSLYDVIKTSTLFDNLIINTELWSKSPSYTRIVYHWSHQVAIQVREMIERKRYFSQLIKMFEGNVGITLSGNLIITDFSKRLNDDSDNKSNLSKSDYAQIDKELLHLIKTAGTYKIIESDIETLISVSYATFYIYQCIILGYSYLGSIFIDLDQISFHSLNQKFKHQENSHSKFTDEFDDSIKPNKIQIDPDFQGKHSKEAEYTLSVFSRYLDIFQTIIPFFANNHLKKEKIKNVADLLRGFIGYTQPEIDIQILICLHDLSNPNCLEIFTIIYYQIMNYLDQNDEESKIFANKYFLKLYEQLLPYIIDRPGLINLAIPLSLKFHQEESACKNLLKLAYNNSCFWLKNDKLWFFWPIVIAVSEPSLSSLISQFLVRVSILNLNKKDNNSSKNFKSITDTTDSKESFQSNKDENIDKEIKIFKDNKGDKDNKENQTRKDSKEEKDIKDSSNSKESKEVIDEKPRKESRKVLHTFIDISDSLMFLSASHSFRTEILMVAYDNIKNHEELKEILPVIMAMIRTSILLSYGRFSQELIAEWCNSPFYDSTDSLAIIHRFQNETIESIDDYISALDGGHILFDPSSGDNRAALEVIGDQSLKVQEFKEEYLENMNLIGKRIESIIEIIKSFIHKSHEKGNIHFSFVKDLVFLSIGQMDNDGISAFVPIKTSFQPVSMDVKCPSCEFCYGKSLAKQEYYHSRHISPTSQIPTSRYSVIFTDKVILYENGVKKNEVISLTKSNLIFYYENLKAIKMSYYFSDILFIFKRGKNLVEFVTSTRTILIELQIDIFETFVQALEQVGRTLDTSLPLFLSNQIVKFKYFSHFEFLSLLNIFTSTFHHPLFFPYLPNFKINKLNSLNVDQNSDIFLDDEITEAYYDEIKASEFFDEDNLSKAMKLRMNLENTDSMLILKFVTAKYGPIPFPARNQLIKITESRKARLFIPEFISEVYYATFFGFSHPGFVYITDKAIFFSSRTTKNQIISAQNHPINITTNAIFATTDEGILIYDPAFNHIIEASLSKGLKEYRTTEKVGQISFMCNISNFIYFTYNDSEVRYSPIEEFPAKNKKIALTSARITALAVQKEWNAFAFATIDCKVEIHSSVTGVTTAIFDTNKEEVTKILISKQWGFVIVATHRSIIVLSINGKKLAEIPIQFEITTWIVQPTCHGFDKLVFANTANQIQMINLIFCDDYNINPKIVGKINANVICVDYWDNGTCYVAIDEMGFFFIFSDTN